jgi:HTH-type transcriptional regulator/antitoxin HigA
VRTGLAEKTISQIINGVAPITYETAGKLEMATGVAARFWNNRELVYREALTRIEEQKRLAADTEWLRSVPVTTLVDRGYVEHSPDKSTLIRNVLKFFGVSSVEAWKNTWLKPAVQYRGSDAQQRHPGYVAAWLRMGELDASKLDCQPYSPKAFRDALEYIRSLTTKNASEWFPELIRVCAAAGVAVVFVPEVPGAAVSGVVKWLTKDKALIQLSLKYKTDDQLWFTFFHEAAHILLHSKKEVFIEDGAGDNLEEQEANEFARDILIPPARTRNFAYLKSKAAIISFAQSIGIAPGIVVGRLQREDILPKSHCNDLKRKLKWGTEPAAGE